MLAVYPGSFDPVTNGHIDIIQRTSEIFDEVVIAIFTNINKNPLFTVEERIIMLQECTRDIKNIRIEGYSGLLTDYLHNINAQILVRGLRAISDFEYEFQMNSMNKKLASDIETVFLMTSNKYAYLSSSIVKEVAMFGGCIKDLVPDNVEAILREKMQK